MNQSWKPMKTMKITIAAMRDGRLALSSLIYALLHEATPLLLFITSTMASTRRAEELDEGTS
jgi:hypothetical protein